MVIYPLYVLFSRQPDYFDGEMSKAIIHHQYDLKQRDEKVIAIYSIDRHTYQVDADYPFRKFTEGEKVDVIYEAAAPENASLYFVWGYWIRWKELLSMIVLFAAMYLIAVSVTSHPTPESLLEELEGSKPQPRKPRYDN